jgi:2-polyprenyl-3-methyl-5-hydroxy-6-metoxy-1,4-benzoquinol methylase
MSSKLVRKYYTGYVQKEWKRLVRDPYHNLEFITTLRYIHKYLPHKSRGHILDAGGGPGRYTITLAKEGYDITLLDLTPANIEFAKKKIKKEKVNVRDVLLGSITNLSMFPDNTFDAVLCLGGPLSHIINKKKRVRAITELIRVAKPGAPIFVSVMCRIGIFTSELRYFPHEISQHHFASIRDTGIYRGGSGFTACHFFLPEELREEFKQTKIYELVGLEGLGAHCQKEVNSLARNKKRWKVWLETHYKYCAHPAVAATSDHMLIVCRKVLKK